MDTEFKYTVHHPGGRYESEPGEPLDNFIDFMESSGETAPQVVWVQAYRRLVDGSFSTPWQPDGGPLGLLVGETGVSDRQLELPLPTPDGEST